MIQCRLDQVKVDCVEEIHSEHCIEVFASCVHCIQYIIEVDCVDICCRLYMSHCLALEKTFRSRELFHTSLIYESRLTNVDSLKI